MADPHWHDRLFAALARQGLPRGYIDRLVEELSEHWHDLTLEDPSMDARRDAEDRLGTPEQVAAAAKAEFQRRTFAGRHPMLTFLAGPIAAMLGSLVAMVLAVVSLDWMLDIVTGGSLSANDLAGAPPSDLEMALMTAMNGSVRFVPFVLPAWFFVRLGKRSARLGWGIVACALVTITAGCFYSVVIRGTGGKGMWMMGFGWRGWQTTIDQLMQAAIPLALGAWMLWRSSLSRPTSSRPTPLAG